MASRRPSKRSAATQPPAYQTVLPKTDLTKKIAEQDSEDNGPPKESRSRTQNTQTASSRHRYNDYNSDEPPAGDRRGGNQKATARSSHYDDRRGRYDSGDNDRYGGSRRDNGNRARNQSESRSRSRSRDRASTKALMKHGESSRALSRQDSRSKANAKGKGRRQARHDDSDDEEEVIKIGRYMAADFDDLEPDFVEEVCKLLDVRASKIKNWCERDLIRIDNTTGGIDMKRVLSVVDKEDAKKLERFLKKAEDEEKLNKMYGGHNQHHGHDRSDHSHDYHHHGHDHPHHQHHHPHYQHDPSSHESIHDLIRLADDLGIAMKIWEKDPGFGDFGNPSWRDNV